MGPLGKEFNTFSYFMKFWSICISKDCALLTTYYVGIFLQSPIFNSSRASVCNANRNFFRNSLNKRSVAHYRSQLTNFGFAPTEPQGCRRSLQPSAFLSFSRARFARRFERTDAALRFRERKRGSFGAILKFPGRSQHFLRRRWRHPAVGFYVTGRGTRNGISEARQAVFGVDMGMVSFWLYAFLCNEENNATGCFFFFRRCQIFVCVWCSFLYF